MVRKKRKHSRDRGQETTHPVKRWHDDLAPETKQTIFATIAFAVALLTLLAYWDLAGAVGRGIQTTLTYAVGRAYFLAPLTLVFVGSSLLFSFRQHVLASVPIGGAIFLASALALVDLFFDSRTGGWIGYLTNWPLERYLDFWGALTIEIALLAVSALMVTNFTPFRKREDEPITPDEIRERTMEKVLGAVTDTVAGVKSVLTKEASEAEVNVKPPPAPMKPNDNEEFMVTKRAVRHTDYVFPPFDLLADDKGTPSSGDIRANANIIKRTLQNFGIDVEMGEVSVGPTVTQYTLKPAEGVKLARIVALQSDLALALAAHPIRIEAPIPGKSLVGIEVPNRSIALVGLRSLLADDAFRQSHAPLLFALGRDVAGTPVYANLAKMPHLLIAGATGSGKSVAIHAFVTALLYRNPPKLLKFIMVDPKRVELASYAGVPHLSAPPITDPKKTIAALRWAVKEMERRYEALSGVGARDITGYNERISQRRDGGELMPYLIIIVDELADLMMSFPREVEGAIVRLAQMARAVGIHLVLATQRPSVEVITGLIKANITSRIAFQVASQIDSRTILDMGGAEKLLGNGDMLFLAGDTAKPRRIQGGFISEREVRSVVEFIVDHNEIPDQAAEEEILDMNGGEGTALADALLRNEGSDENDDEAVYNQARELVVQAQKASTSFLQRRIGLGYSRAARIMDLLEERGVIGPAHGAKPRDVLVKPSESIPSD